MSHGSPSEAEQPSASLTSSALAQFGQWVKLRGLADIDPLDYDSIWRWSTTDLPGFWSAVADYFNTQLGTNPIEILASSTVEQASWFSGATINYAAEALTGADEAIALTAYDESGWVQDITYAQLRIQVAALAATFSEYGVKPGDVVAGYLPNRVEAVVSFLAAASLGAIWTQCAPDYGSSAALDRFAQVKPVALVATRTYQYGGKTHDRSSELAAIVAGLNVQLVVLTDDGEITDSSSSTATLAWASVLNKEPAQPKFIPVPFAHPLWVLFTSGTTGKPKGIVHGHGGIVLEHRKLVAFHLDVRAGEPYFWYSSNNWVMWNIQVGALLVGATAVLYDGSPTWPGPERLWQIAAQSGCVTFGSNPGYLTACETAGIRPERSAHLRMVGSTGAVLTARSYFWVAEVLGPQVLVNSISGGTDVATAFLGSAPLAPIWPGELSRPCLGVASDVWSLDGESLVDQAGELVVTSPMPSMPLEFWQDPDGKRLHETYFDMYPGIWRQGDSITRTVRDSIIIHGRSDATLNRNGIRFGSAEIYDVVERIPAIADSLIVGVDGEQGDYWMPLFVVCQPDADENWAETIRTALRSHLSPRHVPDQVIAVEALPRTRTGKRLEVPLKKALQGQSSDAVLSRGAIDNETAWNELVAVGLSRRPW